VRVVRVKLAVVSPLEVDLCLAPGSVADVFGPDVDTSASLSNEGSYAVTNFNLRDNARSLTPRQEALSGRQLASLRVPGRAA
jgi:hypothetical protein